MSIGRITNASLAATALRGLQGSLGRVQTLQQQLSSGKRVSAPSDDPSAAVSAMTFRSQKIANEQYLRNADAATARLNVTDNTLGQISSRMQAARDLLVQAQNGAIGGESLAALSQQLGSIKQELTDLYNTRYLSRPIFGGTVTGQDAIDAAGVYVGNDKPVETRISRDATVRVDVKGTDAAADTTPALFDQLTADVAAGNTSGISSGLVSLDAALSKVFTALGDVGARETRVDTAKSLVDSQRLDLVSKISDNEDVDLPETIMNLQAQQVAYQSALGAAAKVTQVSLVDFLK